MEQKKPTYDLDEIKHALNSVTKLRMTLSARQTMFSLGFDEDDAIQVIQALTPIDFYKSMEPQKRGLFNGRMFIDRTIKAFSFM
ncbi:MULTISPECIES: type II toxin-antitoxin system MqsR family toxin [unclassified Neptuniibacter]|uniref:type II toxin-antitoxin system MqsR family toxin n=1 Tax=unclassified Neptuniibacter TaxID=2630693 RepID=UPI000C40038E|nr:MULTISPECIES: type II toxin-antitoxin system MqsR family toxin [unclassified Neptuniibacter]MAY41447.1 hypothetical protein [Oceanospirillaceae bacterium]|tara:strand:- start:18385 stop:18636 length:252 start_codon:yes stop_codon:yes gene_type:complete